MAVGPPHTGLIALDAWAAVGRLETESRFRLGRLAQPVAFARAAWPAGNRIAEPDKDHRCTTEALLATVLMGQQRCGNEGLLLPLRRKRWTNTPRQPCRRGQGAKRRPATSTARSPPSARPTQSSRTRAVQRRPWSPSNQDWWPRPVLQSPSTTAGQRPAPPWPAPRPERRPATPRGLGPAREVLAGRG